MGTKRPRPENDRPLSPQTAVDASFLMLQSAAILERTPIVTVTKVLKERESERSPETSGVRDVRSSAILYAFATETLLKAFLVADGKNPRRTHDLLKLFNRLAPETQESIQQNVPGWNVRRILEIHKDSFDRWRYMAEREGHLLCFDFRPFREICSRMIDLWRGQHPKLVGSARTVPDDFRYRVSEESKAYTQQIEEARRNDGTRDS